MLFGHFSLFEMLLSVALVLMAITFHELAHGWAAYRLGDPTAKNQGRLTLNPIKHLDPIGALLLLVVGFGWAKPVPVNPFYLKGNRNRAMMLVALAGPVANLFLAFTFALIYNLGGGFGGVYYLVFHYAITMNISLAVFNLLPIPPLDGSKILAGLLPRELAYKYMSSLEQYGFLILLVLIMFNITQVILNPMVEFFFNLIVMLASFFSF